MLCNNFIYTLESLSILLLGLGDAEVRLGMCVSK